MDVLVIPLPLQCAPCFLQKNSRLRNGQVSLVRSRTFLVVRGVPKLWHQRVEESCRSSLNGSASSFENSSHEDDADEPPIPKKDAENEVAASRRLVNGEKSAKDGHPTTPSALPSEEVLNKLRRDAELKKKYIRPVKPPSQQPSADLQVHDSEKLLLLPSWVTTALTFSVAFSAGVILAQFRGGVITKNKPAIVDVRVAPSGIAAVPFPEQLLGHFRAEEAPESDLKAVLADDSVRLRTAAADAFLRMQDAAKQDNIWLIPLSGFRSVELQRGVFFDTKAERMQSATERAKVCAPPGHSEHHTGYAIDIGDATDPKTYLEPEFDDGAAHRWLLQNAARFHFELSFPKDNKKRIMYEPWHWRFVGDDHSLHTFYAQHKLYNSFPSSHT